MVENIVAPFFGQGVYLLLMMTFDCFKFIDCWCNVVLCLCVYDYYYCCCLFFIVPL